MPVIAPAPACGAAIGRVRLRRVDSLTRVRSASASPGPSPKIHPSMRAWMEAANHALYRAKAAGRNRIATFDGTRLHPQAVM